MFYPVNSKKAVKYGGEPVQSQGAQSTFFDFFFTSSSLFKMVLTPALFAPIRDCEIFHNIS
ncbi:MAG: hypothetical protein CMO74_07415 [Verrucomicrobiales bacterium]|nr:hypothetical protein [Verrucomicrobiales bacterium]